MAETPEDMNDADYAAHVAQKTLARLRRDGRLAKWVDGAAQDDVVDRLTAAVLAAIEEQEPKAKSRKTR